MTLPPTKYSVYDLASAAATVTPRTATSSCDRACTLAVDADPLVLRTNFAVLLGLTIGLDMNMTGGMRWILRGKLEFFRLPKLVHPQIRWIRQPKYRSSVLFENGRMRCAISVLGSLAIPQSHSPQSRRHQ